MESEGGPMSLQQTLIDLAIVSLLAALAPIVSGLLSRRCLRW